MFPKLTNIEPIISASIKSNDTIQASKLNCFVRIISGVGTGLIMTSNPDWKLFSAAGFSEPTFYGDSAGSGTIGVSWTGKPVYAAQQSMGQDVPFKPSPIVTAINVKEGKDQISRHCDLKITAYTIAQVEVLQTYMMEPGFSLFIEYGWNTNLGVSGLIPIKYNTIVSDAGKYSLDQISLHKKRVDTHGEYDSFLGFIVGGTVTSNGDLFDINIKLRGAPGLPTYLQSQASIEEIVDGKVSNKYSVTPFGVTELNLEAAEQMAERRFKQMFNDLPKTRQTTFVRDLIGNNGKFSNLDFINFDPVIQVQISNFAEGRDASGAELPKDEPIVPKNAGNTAKEVEEAGGLNPKKLQEIAEAIIQKQAGFKDVATPPTVVTGGFFTIDTAWENYLQSKQSAGDPITRAEIDAAIAKYIDVKSTNFTDGVGGTVKGYSYTKKPEPPPPAATNTAASTSGAAGTSGTAGASTAQQTGGGGTARVEAVAATEIKLAGGLVLPKEKLFSKNRYVRFGKAVDIINTNSGIQSYIVAGRSVNAILNVKNTPIGAFKGIYSTKPETLVIPGLIPDFTKFFMEQNLANLSDNEPLVDLSIGPLSFAQSTALNSGGFKENAYYWGKLENLYINFELLKKELDTPNKTIREILESLLNEMSSAVDAFWNFQIVEKSEAVKDNTGTERNTLIYTVVDENWIGANPNPAPVKFTHSGEQSRFLDADLNIDIPGSMASQIVSKRLSLSVNPSQPNLELGGIFSKGVDQFLKAYIDAGSASTGTTTTNTTTTTTTTATSEDDKKLEERFNKIPKGTLTDAQQKEMQTLKDAQNANSKAATDLDAEKARLKGLESTRDSRYRAQAAILDKYDGTRGTDFDVDGDEIDDPKQAAIERKKLEDIDKEIAALKKKVNDGSAAIKTKEDEINKSVEDFEKGANEQIVANISTNLDKIDVVPNPAENSITATDLNNFLTDPALFKQKFRIYCCRDAKYLNILKTNAMGVKSGGGGRLSHPLPIKYSFTILGKSGIRRGDTFNIDGIPKKYEQNGLFQVTEIEQTIQNMKWTTRVQGEYRQQQ